MAASLFALLSQQGGPNLPTRRGLLVLGLQNDHLAPDGKLPVSTKSAFLDNLERLIPSFRESGTVVWVRTESVPNTNGTDTAAVVDAQNHHNRMNQRDNDGSNLSRQNSRDPACVRGSTGADYADRIKPLIDSRRDLHIVKTHKSAFAGTDLVSMLRGRLITELFLCGCNTNHSMYATAMDAARHGIQITLVEDCLGYRKKLNHDKAVKKLRHFIDVEVVTSTELMDTVYPTTNSRTHIQSYDAAEPVSTGMLDHGAATVADSQSDGDDAEVRLPIVPTNNFTHSLPLRPRKRSNDYGTSRITSSRAPEGRAAKMSRSNSPQDVDSSKHPDGSDKSVPPPRSASVKRMRPGQRNRDLENALLAAQASIPKPKLPFGLSRLDSSASPDPTFLFANTNAPVRPAATSTHPGLNAFSNILGFDQKTVQEYEVGMRKASSPQHQPLTMQAKSQPLFGEDKTSESAGSRISFDLLPDEIATTIFDDINDEVRWQTMHHQTGEVPRLVCCQGEIDADGSMPVYRHPSDQTLPLQKWTPAVDQVRKAAEREVGHQLNHVLIQLYRSGNDYISEHSDKTLDIAAGSNIVNVSFGAQRTMRLRTKRAKNSPSATRITHRIPMPHNSMLVMSLPTNAEYLHGINADKRPGVELAEAEKAFEGQRISLTFRNIATFLDRDSKTIWGQGAIGKSRDEARPVISGDTVESEKLIYAFGSENQATSIDWQGVYGAGSDVLHLK